MRLVRSLSIRSIRSISALALCACGLGAPSSSATSAGMDAGVMGIVESLDSGPPANACLTLGPTGAACRSGGVCGLGEVNDTDFLCLASIDVCCVPATALGIDAGVETLPDGGVVNVPDGALNMGHDAGKTGKDAGHDAGKTVEHDAGHDSGHDAGMKPVDAGKPNDAKHG